MGRGIQADDVSFFDFVILAGLLLVLLVVAFMCGEYHERNHWLDEGVIEKYYDREADCLRVRPVQPRGENHDSE